MPKSSGSGTIYKRGDIWWVKIRVDGKPVYESSKSTKKSDAIALRDKLIAQRHRGEISGGHPERVLINELLDDVLKSDIKASTRYVWEKVIEKSIRPFFGKIKARRLTTDLMEKYRDKRKAEGRSESTANRELSILRTAFHNARKRTPPKVSQVPYFPMVQETTVRQGFLSDGDYTRLRDELPAYLQPLFVTAYLTGIRKGELLPLTWSQVDFESGLITLERHTTKNQEARSVPIIPGDMDMLLSAAKKQRDQEWPASKWVFNRNGQPIKDFRGAWDQACKRAGVEGLHFHDLRRTAVRNMRRAGVQQVIRMKISGHKTDSMERRYNIVDAQDLASAKDLMGRRLSAAGFVTADVTTARNSVKQHETADAEKPAT